MPDVISDPRDPRLDDYRQLHDARARRVLEAPGPDEPGCFIAEGPGTVRRLLSSGRRVRSVLLDPRRLPALLSDLAGLDAPVYQASPEVLATATGFNVHRGVLAVADRWPLPEPGEILAGALRVAVLEGLNDHENVGAVFRSASALGVDAALLSPNCCDPLYRRSVRVSLGHVITLPWTRLVPWPEALDQLREAGFTLAALTPDPAADDLGQGAAALAGSRLAVLLGAEGPGLSAAARDRVDHFWRIPMRPGADSLNVAAAAAVAFFATRTT